MAATAQAICDAVDDEPSDEVAFEGYERAMARERRAGADVAELRAALDERCGRAIAAITAAASGDTLDPEPETQAEPTPEVAEEPEVVFTDLRPIDWVYQTWTTDCTEDGLTHEVELALEGGQGVHRPSEPAITPIYVVELDNVIFGDVTGNGHEDALFVTQCVFASAEYFVEVWSHDENGQPLHLPLVHHYSKFEAVVDRVEAVNGRLRVHSREGTPGDDMPHINGYPVEVVTDWHHDGNGWVDDEISRTDITPEPEPEPEPSSGVGECEGAGSSPESAALCLYAAARDGNLDAAQEVAGPGALAQMRELIDYWGEEYEWAWEFGGCDGGFVDPPPPFDVACHFYAPASDPNYHGTLFEFRLNLVGGSYFVEQTEGFG